MNTKKYNSGSSLEFRALPISQSLKSDLIMFVAAEEERMGDYQFTIQAIEEAALQMGLKLICEAGKYYLSQEKQVGGFISTTLYQLELDPEHLHYQQVIRKELYDLLDVIEEKLEVSEAKAKELLALQSSISALEKKSGKKAKAELKLAKKKLKGLLISYGLSKKALNDQAELLNSIDWPSDEIDVISTWQINVSDLGWIDIIPIPQGEYVSLAAGEIDLAKLATFMGFHVRTNFDVNPVRIFDHPTLDWVSNSQEAKEALTQVTYSTAKQAKLVVTTPSDMAALLEGAGVELSKFRVPAAVAGRILSQM